MRFIHLPLLIQLLTFQLCFGELYAQTAHLHNKRVPASHYTAVLLEKMRDFKVSLVGEEEVNKCQEQNTTAGAKPEPSKKMTWQEYLQDLGQERAVQGQDNNKTDDEDCLGPRKEGHLGQLLARIVAAEEKNKGDYRMITLDYQELGIPSFHQRALEFKKHLEDLLDSSMSVESKRDILLEYLELVALPMRDYFIALQVYLDTEVDTRSVYESLLPTIPSDISEGEESKTFASTLLKGKRSPLALQVERSLIGDDRLVYHPVEALQRDVLTVLKAPTAANYVHALKWMSLSMMLKQVEMYDAMNGIDQAQFEVPKSCQAKHNGSLPATIASSLTPEKGQEIVNNILLNQKLVFPEDDVEFIDYYLYNVDRDPLLDGYSGLMPFEQYKAAKQATMKTEDDQIRPDFDDYTHFQQIVDLKLPRALAVFNPKHRYLFGLVDFADQRHHGDKIFESFFKPAADNEELTAYISDLMARHQVDHWTDLISDQLEQFLQNNRIIIPFPSFFGSSFRRQAAFNALTSWLEDNLDKDLTAGEDEAFFTMCRFSKGELSGLCENRHSKEIRKRLLAYLRSIKNADDFVPTREYNDEKHLTTYKMMRFLWKELSRLHSETGNFAISETDEAYYLLDQFSVGNPWAKARLSYLLALDELGAISEGVLPEFSELDEKAHRNYVESLKVRKRRNLHSADRKIRKHAEKTVSLMRKAARMMGISTVLHPGHANYILSGAEKKLIWEDIAQEGSELFSFKDDNDVYLYQKLDTVAARTLLTDNKVNDFIKSSFMEDELDEKAQETLKSIMESELGQKGQLMMEIYKLKDDPEKQLDYFERFVEEFGMDNEFSVKLNFLHLDNAIKAQLYKSLLRHAAKEKRSKISEAMDELCSLEAQDFDSMKHIYFASVKQQNALNQLNGEPVLSQKTLGKIEKMLKGSSKWERREGYLGMGFMAATVGAYVLVGSCVATGGATCVAAAFLAPLVGSIQLGLGANEYRKKRRSDKAINQVEMLEELGYIDQESIDELKLGWTWTVVEIGSAIPLIAITARSFSVGSKTLATTSQAIKRQAGMSFKERTKHIAKETELNSWRLVLELDQRWPQMKDFFKNISKLTPIQVLEGVQKIDEQAAQVVSDYLGHEPKALQHLLNSYLNRLPKATREMDKMEQVSSGSVLPFFRKTVTPLLHEHLNQYGPVIKKLKREIDLVVENKGDLQQFVLQHMDDLTDVFMKIPVRKNELPYTLLAQGGAHMGRGLVSMGGKAYFLANGLVLRKLFNARSSLVYEAILTQARQSLGLSAQVAQRSTYDIFQTFQQSMIAFVKEGDQAARLAKQQDYNKLQSQIVQALARHSKEKDKKLIRRLVLNPRNLKERARGQAIWDSVKSEKIFGLDKMQENAYRLAREQYSTIDGFEQRFSALKVLMLDRKGGLVEMY